MAPTLNGYAKVTYNVPLMRDIPPVPLSKFDKREIAYGIFLREISIWLDTTSNTDHSE